MAYNTEHLGLFCYDPNTDSDYQFSFEQALNSNWDVLDTYCDNILGMYNGLSSQCNSLANLYNNLVKIDQYFISDTIHYITYTNEFKIQTGYSFGNSGGPTSYVTLPVSMHYCHIFISQQGTTNTYQNLCAIGFNGAGFTVTTNDQNCMLSPFFWLAIGD